MLSPFADGFLAAAPIACGIRGYLHGCMTWLTLVGVLVEVKDSGGASSKIRTLMIIGR